MVYIKIKEFIEKQHRDLHKGKYEFIKRKTKGFINEQIGIYKKTKKRVFTMKNTDLYKDKKIV